MSKLNKFIGLFFTIFLSLWLTSFWNNENVSSKSSSPILTETVTCKFIGAFSGSTNKCYSLDEKFSCSWNSGCVITLSWSKSSSIYWLSDLTGTWVKLQKTKINWKNKTIKFTNPKVTEIITCKFINVSSGSINTCINLNENFSCSGTTSCSVKVISKKGTIRHWTSGITWTKKYKTTMDWKNDIIKFIKKTTSTTNPITYTNTTDRFTGTLWDGNIITDTTTGLMWESVPTTTKYSWDNAKSYCDWLNLWWYTNWRMPSIDELKSIVDSSYSSSNYWHESKFTLKDSSCYWSSTTNKSYTDSARFLCFGDATTVSDTKASHLSVICTSYTNTTTNTTTNPITYTNITDRFTGTLWVENIITDTTTGLMWETIPTTTQYTWDNAKSYCDWLNLWWYTDWRMPTITELETIVDKNKIDWNNHWYASKFKLEASYYWSSTTVASDTTNARFLDFDSADMPSNYKTNDSHVICTR